MSGHRSDIINNGRIGYKLAEHTKTTGHNFKLDEVDILQIEKNKGNYEND